MFTYKYGLNVTAIDLCYQKTGREYIQPAINLGANHNFLTHSYVGTTCNTYLKLFAISNQVHSIS